MMLRLTTLFIIGFSLFSFVNAEEKFNDNIRVDYDQNFYHAYQDSDQLVDFAYQNQKDIIGEDKANRGKQKLLQVTQEIAQSFTRYDLMSMTQFTQACFKKMKQQGMTFIGTDVRFILEQFSRASIELDCDTSSEAFFLIAYFVQKAYPNYEILPRIQFVTLFDHQAVVLTSGKIAQYGELFVDGNILFYDKTMYTVINKQYKNEAFTYGQINVLKSMMVAVTALHYMDKSDYAEAAKRCEQALTYNSNNTCAIKNAALFFCWADAFTKALTYFTEYQKYKSFDNVEYYWLGKTYMGLMQFENAVQAYQNAIDYNPRDSRMNIFEYALAQAKEKVAL